MELTALIHRALSLLLPGCCLGPPYPDFFMFLPHELNPLPAHNWIPHCCQSHSALFFNSNKTLQTLDVGI